ncbi:MAG: hypothetical protein HY905_24960 [Deltaproteobacteria bacterium]|nr:hypothetical protein [Deltaproteobacteria bacterium]
MMALRTLIAAILALTATSPASASVADVFGLGSAAVGAGDAAAAEAVDFAACHYDPAGLAAARGPSVHLGYAVADARVTVAGRALEVAHAGGLFFGLSVPIELHWSWLESAALGLALYGPPDVVVALRAGAPWEPGLPYYDNRVARWLVLPALALRFPGGVSVGAAVDIFAGIRGPVEIVEGPTGAEEGRTELEMFGAAAPIVGVRWDVRRWLSFAVVYRAEFSSPAATVARVDAGGATVRLEASMAGLYRPHTIVAGAAVRGERWRAALDLSWEHWSAFRTPLADVAVDWQGVGLDPGAVELPFRDSFGVRLGGELRLAAGPAELAVRAGYGFESRILPEDAPGAALLDGDKHVLSTGLGLRLPLAERVLTLDAHLAAHLLAGASAVSPGAERGDPEVRLTASGAVLSAGLTLGVEW